MSTIKSSNEHLTINADGSGKSVKFQANGVEKASISSAGAFTSTTIDATKLTGTLPAISGASLTNVNAVNAGGRKNLLINGDMQVFQRATGATASTTTYKTADRWMLYDSSSGAFTSEKYAMSLAELNTTGHSQALELNVTTADTSIAAGEFCFIRQIIEGQNLQQLQYGTAAAKDLTLSFWVKSKIAGIYCVQILKTSSTAYSLPIEYTINNVDTWEYKTITYTPTAGSTSLITNSGGVITNDNNGGMQVTFGLVWGSDYHGTNNTWTSAAKYATSNQVNWMSSTSNDFYLAGVQLEVASVATDFEHRSFSEERELCKRYFQIIRRQIGLLGWAGNTGGGNGDVTTLSPQMRTNPTLFNLITPAYSSTVGSLPNSAGGSATSTNITRSVSDDGRSLKILNNVTGNVIFSVKTLFTLDAEL